MFIQAYLEQIETSPYLRKMPSNFWHPTNLAVLAMISLISIFYPVIITQAFVDKPWWSAALAIPSIFASLAVLIYCHRKNKIWSPIKKGSIIFLCYLIVMFFCIAGIFVKSQIDEIVLTENTLALWQILAGFGILIAYATIMSFIAMLCSLPAYLIGICLYALLIVPFVTNRVILTKAL